MALVWTQDFIWNTCVILHQVKMYMLTAPMHADGLLQDVKNIVMLWESRGGQILCPIRG